MQLIREKQQCDVWCIVIEFIIVIIFCSDKLSAMYTCKRKTLK